MNAKRAFYFFERPTGLGVKYSMKKSLNPYRKLNRARYSLGELVSVLGSCSRDNRETVAALVDLFQTGRVRVNDHGHLKRVRVCT